MKKLKFNSTLDHKQSDYKTREITETAVSIGVSSAMALRAVLSTTIPTARRGSKALLPTS